MRTAIREAYNGDLNNIDVWIGAIAEDHVPGSSVGELIQTGLIEQFSRLRDGDRFYYENVFSPDEIVELENTRLSDIIARNTGLTSMHREVFREPSVMVYRADAGQPTLDLTARLSSYDQIELVDNQSGQVVDSRAADQASTLVVFGTRGDDRLLIDASLTQMRRLPIEVHGGGGQDVLSLAGSSRPELITVHPAEVRYNNSHITFGNIEIVHVQGGGGNDYIRVGENITARVVVDGGEGRDVLVGSSGDDILIGGAGNDVLVGKQGRDLLIGGTDRDQLSGRRGGDLLIHGATSFDADPRALAALLAEWTSPRSYTQRIENLTGNGSGERLNADNFLVADLTVLDDQQRDVLMGGQSQDWFFAGSQDRLVGRGGSEIV